MKGSFKYNYLTPIGFKFDIQIYINKNDYGVVRKTLILYYAKKNQECKSYYFPILYLFANFQANLNENARIQNKIFSNYLYVCQV